MERKIIEITDIDKVETIILNSITIKIDDGRRFIININNEYEFIFSLDDILTKILSGEVRPFVIKKVKEIIEKYKGGDK